MATPNYYRKITRESASSIMYIGPFLFDFSKHEVQMNGQTISISPCAYDYLATLARNFPHPVSYQDLILESQGYQLGRLESQDLARFLTYTLRKTLETDSQSQKYILAVAGYGYRLAV